MSEVHLTVVDEVEKVQKELVYVDPDHTGFVHCLPEYQSLYYIVQNKDIKSAKKKTVNKKHLQNFENLSIQTVSC